jgi:hypothetical protein
MKIRGLPRREAERAAFDIILIEFLNRAQPDARSEPQRLVRQIPEAGRNPVAVRRRRSPHVAARGLLGGLARAAQDRGDRPARSDRDRRACESDEMTGQKVPMSARWKRRRAPGAPEPLNAPAPLILRVDEARVRIERARIARWVAAQTVSYPPDRCFGCRRPIVYGAKWVELVNDNDRARFHSDCAPVWRTQQEVAARRALRLDRSERE